MNVNYACNSAEHGIARRQFLGTLAAVGAGAMTGGLGVFSTPAIANPGQIVMHPVRRLDHLRRQQRQSIRTRATQR